MDLNELLKECLAKMKIHDICLDYYSKIEKDKIVCINKTRQKYNTLIKDKELVKKVGDLICS